MRGGLYIFVIPILLQFSIFPQETAINPSSGANPETTIPVQENVSPNTDSSFPPPPRQIERKAPEPRPAGTIDGLADEFPLMAEKYVPAPPLKDRADSKAIETKEKTNPSETPGEGREVLEGNSTTDAKTETSEKQKIEDLDFLPAIKQLMNRKTWVNVGLLVLLITTFILYRSRGSDKREK